MKRRDFLKVSSAAVALTCIGGMSCINGCSMVKGKSKVPEANPNSFSFSNNQVTLNLNDNPELKQNGAAIKFSVNNQNKEPIKLLVVNSENGYIAYADKCTHGGRELNFLYNEKKLQCSSFGKSEFNLQGKVLSGPAKDDLTLFTLEQKNNELIIYI